MKTIEILKENEQARLGLLTTGHGTVKTPVFMPVGTLGTVKALAHKDLSDLGFGMILANAYHLYLRPGDELIRDMGGLHRFIGWKGAILTDSGGYQIFSLGLLRKIRDDGVEFQSHVDGSRHILSPERVVEIQENIGADICMCLDECVQYPASRDYTEKSTELTSRWALRSKKARKKTGYSLFGIIQGGFYEDLRVKSALDIVEMDFDGYAIGGLSVGEPKAHMWDMVDTVIGHMPDEKPRYLMGVGFPDDILEGVKRGIDMFDCIIPTRVARNGGLFTRNGKLNIKNARYARDHMPIDDRCTCYTCRTFSRAYLRHLCVSHELSSFYLNTLHNLHFYARLMDDVRTALTDNNFSTFYKDFMHQWKGGEPES